MIILYPKGVYINREYTYAYELLWNNSQYSKLALGNTAWHIRTYLERVINHSDKAFKLTLFSGHDTTIMPLLASILGDSWDRKWAGYASLMTIELYNSSNLNINIEYYFRLIYNGQVLQVPGCVAKLCDVNILLQALAFGEEVMPCSISTTTSSSDYNHQSNMNSITTADWIGITIVSSFMGILLGAALIVFTYKRNIEQGYLTVYGSTNIIDSNRGSDFVINT